MAGIRVPEYGAPQVAVSGAPRASQRAVTQSGGLVAKAVVGLGENIARFAVAEDKRLEALDEAEVMELDAQFGDWERETLRGENGFLRQRGRNALNAEPATVEAFEAEQQRQLELAQGDRQKAMLMRVQQARRTRFMDTIASHAATETETYWDESFNARAGSLSNDLATSPDDPDRLPRMIALRDMYVDYGQRKGWDADQVRAAQLGAFTNVHKASVANLLEAGDPYAAQAYLEQWEPQIEATAVTQLKGVVREQVDRYDADAFWSSEEAKAPALPEVTGGVPSLAGGPSGATFRLREPVAASVSSDFGPRRPPTAGASSNHGGVDYAVPAFTPVAAAGPGTVKFAGEQRGYGNVVIVDHGGGVETVYAHLGRINVEQGAVIQAGQRVALSGGARGMAGAGTSTGAHLHFEVRKGGQAVDPDSVLGSDLTGGASGGARAQARAPQVRTLEDVYETADKVAGGDLRRREAFRAAGVARYQRERSFEADRERLAADQVSPYLPGGANAAASYDAIPLNIRQGLSPQQDLAIRNTFIRQAEQADARRTDPSVQNSLLDQMAFNPQRFASLDLTQYADDLSQSDWDSLRQNQRQIQVAASGGNTTVGELATRALSGTDDTVNRLIKSAGLENDEVARAQLRQYTFNQVVAQVGRDGTAPSEQEIVGIMLNGLRVYEVEGRDPRNPNRRQDTRAYDLRPSERSRAFVRIPRGTRSDIVRRLRASGVQNPSSTQVQEFYSRGLRTGLYRQDDLAD